MSKRGRSAFALLGVAGLVVVGALIAGGTVALAGSGGSGLHAQVLATAAGPLPACAEDGSNCTLANTVHYYLRIKNGNGLTNAGSSTGTRASVQNSFVVDSIDSAVFVNGVQDHDFDFTYTPPPNPSYEPYSGHWIVSATCPAEGPPCNVVDTNPAVLPQEDATVFWTGWAHGDAEPNGTYVFKFKIHGSFNGTAVDLNASSPPIVMTS
jgi:hypothetical protein